jgi:ribosomal protein S18 acetylase RimI-like enzyme
VSSLRPYEPGDLADVYNICVKTGASGADATGKFSDDDLLPDIYAGPYVRLQPEFAFVVDGDDRVAGYVVAAADTPSFVQRYREEWLPGFAAKYSLVEPACSLEERVISIGHHPESMLNAGLDDYPAHLHIDLLPEVQGQGLGRLLIRTLLEALGDAGVKGVHLGVGPKNLEARAFYARLGFRPLPSDPSNDSVLGISTSATV